MGVVGLISNKIARPFAWVATLLCLLVLWVTPAFAVTLTDDAGRTVTLSGTPKRIVSLVPSITETLFAIGAGHLVVGVDINANYPEQVAQLPKVNAWPGPDFERIVALKPDLVLGLGMHARAEFAAKFRELGIPIFVLDPQSASDIYHSIDLAGRLTGHQKEAQAVIAQIQADIEAIRKKVAGRKAPRVFYEVWHDPLMTVAKGSYIHDIIELAGGQNIVAEAGNPWPTVSPEIVIARDPEVIIADANSVNAIQKGERPAWLGVAAVRNKRLLTLPGDLLSRPGPRLAQAVEHMARALHPEVFGG